MEFRDSLSELELRGQITRPDGSRLESLEGIDLVQAEVVVYHETPYIGLHLTGKTLYPTHKLTRIEIRGPVIVDVDGAVNFNVCNKNYKIYGAPLGEHAEPKLESRISFDD